MPRGESESTTSCGITNANEHIALPGHINVEGSNHIHRTKRKQLRIYQKLSPSVMRKNNRDIVQLSQRPEDRESHLAADRLVVLSVLAVYPAFINIVTAD